MNVPPSGPARRIAALSILLLAAGRLCAAGPVSVSVGVDRTEAHIGERIRYTVVAEAPAGTKVRMPAFGETLGGLTVCDSGVAGPEVPPGEEPSSSGKRVWKAWCLLTAYELKAFEIPAPVVEYESPDGTRGKVSGEPVSVKIVSVLDSGEEMKDIRDIQGPVTIPAKRGWLYLLLAGVAAGVVLLVLVIIILKRRRREEPVAPKPRPPHEIALEELARLKASDLIAAGRVKEFYFRLTDIVRRYLENRFKLAAPERTTEEFLAMLADSQVLAPRHKELVAGFLRHCDLVKFAKYGPTEAEMNGAFDSAEKLVKETSGLPTERAAR